MKLIRGVYELLKSAVLRCAFGYLCMAWLSEKLKDFRVVVLQVAQPPEAAKGLAKMCAGRATSNNGRNNGN